MKRRKKKYLEGQEHLRLDGVESSPAGIAASKLETKPWDEKSPLSYTITTDGGCWPNDGAGNGGWAYIREHLNNGEAVETTECCGAERKTTNNRMELTAILHGIQSTPNGVNVLVRTDSRYAMDSCSIWWKKWAAKGWRKKLNADNGELKNADLIKAVVEACSTRRVRWEWVKGHANDARNNRCDELAEFMVGTPHPDSPTPPQHT